MARTVRGHGRLRGSTNRRSHRPEAGDCGTLPATFASSTPATFAPAASTDDEPIVVDVMPSGGHECEVGGYMVRARRTNAWDAIVTLLLELDADHHDYFHAVMQRVSKTVQLHARD